MTMSVNEIIHCCEAAQREKNLPVPVYSSHRTCPIQTGARSPLLTRCKDPFEIGDAAGGRLVAVLKHSLCVYSSHIDLRAVAGYGLDDVVLMSILIRDRSLSSRIDCSSKGLDPALDQAQKHSCR